MTRPTSKNLIATASLIMAAVASGCGLNRELPMTTLQPKGDLGQWIYGLFVQVTLWDAIVLVIVLVAFFMAVFVTSTRFGEASPRPELEDHMASHVKLEVAWTVGPALILLMITIPTVRTIFRSQPAVAPKDALVIKVVAHQWWWEFQYPNGEFITANELHIPTDRPVRLNLFSADVIHSFWVPQLGGKRDVIPGQINELEFIARVPGMYPGQCAEFCGDSHANMRFRVFVQSPQDYAKWETVEKTAPPAADQITQTAAAEGAKVFSNSPCTTCHRIDGVSKGYMGPDLSHFGSRTTMAGAIMPNTPENVAKWITNPQAVKPGAQMPALGLSGQQLTDLVAYLESLK